MYNVWLAVLAISLTALCIIIFKIRMRWFKYALVNIALAAVFLYALNEMNLFGSYALPINFVTLGTTGLLGLPGLVLLFSLKMLVK